jgi:iron complex outermembrane recepter protein
LLLGAALLIGGTAAQAAEQEAQGLETIIVTAQKKAENIQSVPISISAVTGAAIEKAHVVNLEALTGSIPNVQINHFSNTPTGAVFNIRGMGVIEPDPYAGQTVTVVVDGVPQVFNMTSLPDLFDVERIEILRGPQGTLFGANTTGGVVNIVTKQPNGRSEGTAMASIGNYNRLDANVALNFPITETLAGKISALHHAQDGFVTNIMDGTPMGNQNITAIRGYLKFQPSDDFNATLIQEVDRGRNGSPVVVQGGVPGEAEYVPPGEQPPGALLGQYPSPCLPVGQPCHAPDHYYSANNSVPDKDAYNIYATTLTANWSGPIGELVSITGYKRFNEDNYTDQDGTVRWIDDTRRTTNGYQISQEIRDTIHPTDSMRLLFGAFASYDTYFHIQNFRIPGLAGGAPLRQVITQDQTRRSYSIFAQGYFDLTDKLKMQAGVRGTTEKTRMLTATSFHINLTPGGSAVFQGDTQLSSTPASGEKSWKNVGGKIGLDYHWTDHMMAYGYVARGFKSGGFVGRISFPESIGPYDPEYVNTIELGLKADWLDNRLRTNVSVFFNKYKDLQLSQIIFKTDPTTGANINDNTIQNAARAETKGIELEVTAVPTSNLTLNASVAFLDAKYKEYNYKIALANATDPFPAGSIPCPGNPTAPCFDRSGTDLQNSPRSTASAGINYRWPVATGAITFGAQYRYTGTKYFTSLLNTPRSKIQATKYVDLNADWTPSEDGKVSFSVWGRNVADSRYIASVYDAPGTLGLVNYEPPREFGFTVNYNW